MDLKIHICLFLIVVGAFAVQGRHLNEPQPSSDKEPMARR